MILTAGLTFLALSGTPGLPAFRAATSSDTPRTYSQPYTSFGITATPGLASGPFSGRVAESVASLDVSDTASLTATEEPFDRNELATTDTARLSAADVSQMFNRIDVTDTASIAAGETIALLQSGVTLKTASDAASLSASDISAVGVTIDVSDTASLTATDTSAVAVAAATKVVSDTASLSADDIHLLEIFAGIVDKVASDTAFLRVTDSAAVIEIRRIKRISLEIRAPRITLEII